MGRNVLALAVAAALAMGACRATDLPAAPGAPKEGTETGLGTGTGWTPPPGWCEEWIKKHCGCQEEKPTLPPVPTQQERGATASPIGGSGVESVPEPGTAALLALGAGALLFRRRKPVTA
ncbi:MAG: PEP-CTERM sorting domain-containing protein [Gemmataceae bacterium]|nr:PEP-CTERM sorting domain-containing protein [Gemmataceae bacterium]